MLYIVATPIGNLKDITLRALEVLKEVDLIACEDTRVTRKLLNRYDIKTSLISYHQHSKITRINYLVDELKKGKDIALVTDAGTSGISDPGGKLVEKAVKNGVKVIPVPGASALAAIVSAAGINLQKFVFLGFPPHKKGRRTFVADILERDIPVVVYESKYRLLKLLEDISGYGGEKRIKIIAGRELTKLHEEVIRGHIDDVIEYFKNNKEKLRGEFAIIIYKEK